MGIFEPLAQMARSLADDFQLMEYIRPVQVVMVARRSPPLDAVDGCKNVGNAVIVCARHRGLASARILLLELAGTSTGLTRSTFRLRRSARSSSSSTRSNSPTPAGISARRSTSELSSSSPRPMDPNTLTFVAPNALSTPSTSLRRVAKTSEGRTLWLLTTPPARAGVLCSQFTHLDWLHTTRILLCGPTERGQLAPDVSPPSNIASACGCADAGVNRVREGKGVFCSIRGSAEQADRRETLGSSGSSALAPSVRRVVKERRSRGWTHVAARHLRTSWR